MLLTYPQTLVGNPFLLVTEALQALNVQYTKQQLFSCSEKLRLLCGYARLRTNSEAQAEQMHIEHVSDGPGTCLLY